MSEGNVTEAVASTPARGEWSLYTRIVAFLARSLVWVLALGRVRVQGLSDLPSTGPLIIVANHVSNLDPPLVGGWLAPALRRRPRFLAKEPLFVGPLGWFLRSQGVISVRSGGRDVDAYRVAKAALDEGSVIVIYPEGTRSPDGVLQDPLPGVALLAMRTGVPILPAGVSDTDRLLGRGSRLPRFGTAVTLRVGQPFTVEIDASLPRRQALNAASERIMGSIAALIDERHRGRFG